LNFRRLGGRRFAPRPAARAIDRQRPQANGVEQLEDRGVGADAEHQRQRTAAMVNDFANEQPYRFTIACGRVNCMIPGTNRLSVPGQM
jgi:hypothetical protein